MQLIIPPHTKLSTPVKRYSEIKNDAREMVKLIEANSFPGAWKVAFAIAHPQVSQEPKTFFVVNRTDPVVRKTFRHKVIINPVIVEKENRVIHPEACMSVPWKGIVKKKRHAMITVRYQFPAFGFLFSKTIVCTGLQVFIFQHEMEHLKATYL